MGSTYVKKMTVVFVMTGSERDACVVLDTVRALGSHSV